MLERATSSNSNWTGRPVFCCKTVALVLTRPPLASSLIRIFATSQPRNLLSIVRSKSARSRRRRSWSSQNRIAQTCCGLSARFAPTMRPAFHGRLSRVAGSNSECPILSSSWPDWPCGGSAACLPGRHGVSNAACHGDGWFAARQLSGDEPAEADVYSFY